MAIARTYNFSTRLQGTIQGWDEARRQVAERLPRTKRSPHKSSRLGGTTSSTLRPRRTIARPGDVEKGIADADAGIPHRRATSATAAAQELVGHIDEEDLDMYKLLQEQYNYTTIDHAPNCKPTIISWTRINRGKGCLTRSQSFVLVPTGFTTAQNLARNRRKERMCMKPLHTLYHQSTGSGTSSRTKVGAASLLVSCEYRNA